MTSLGWLGRQDKVPGQYGCCCDPPALQSPLQQSSHQSEPAWCFYGIVRSMVNWEVCAVSSLWLSIPSQVNSVDFAVQSYSGPTSIHIPHWFPCSAAYLWLFSATRFLYINSQVNSFSIQLHWCPLCSVMQPSSGEHPPQTTRSCSIHVHYRVKKEKKRSNYILFSSRTSVTGDLAIVFLASSPTTEAKWDHAKLSGDQWSLKPPQMPCPLSPCKVLLWGWLSEVLLGPVEPTQVKLYFLGHKTIRDGDVYFTIVWAPIPASHALMRMN